MNNINKFKFRIIALILVLMMLLPSVAACSSDSGETQNTTKESGGGEEAIQAATEETKSVTQQVFDKLPDEDYGGYVFRCVTAPASWSDFLENMITSELTGDIVFDAVYERNIAVEERFNCKIDKIVRDAGAITSYVKNSVLSGDDAFDLVLHWTNEMGAMPFNEYFIDLRQQKYIDMSQPWYPKKTNDAMMVNGKQYFTHSEMTANTSALAFTFFYNLDIAQTCGLPDIYPIVFEGKWTIDKMLEHIKGVSKDVNGDGQMKITDDIFGLGMDISVNEPLLAMQYGMGHFTADVNASGAPTLEFDIGRLSAIVDKLNYLFYASGEAIGTKSTWDAAIAAFTEGRLLMVNCVMMMADRRFRSMEQSYTVLPPPKLDETQAEYYTTMPSVSSTVVNAIPVTVQNADRSAIIFEALSAVGYDLIRPAFFEVALKTKYAKDDKVSQMFDLVMASNTIDFGFIYDGKTGIRDIIFQSVNKNANTVASDFEKRKDKAQEYYDEVLERYK